MVVTDMDGTFLSSQNSYNEKRFEVVFEELKKHDIPFVIATGNNMKRLSDLFPKHADQLTFIAENGAQLVHQGKELYSRFMDIAEQELLLTFIEANFPESHHFLSGGDVTYVLESLPEKDRQILAQYFSRLETVSHLNQVSHTPLYRITMQFEGDTDQKIALIEKRLQGTNLRVVSTGFGWLDILPKSVHKAMGLDYLMAKWGILPSEVVAFGDSPNDLEMLANVEYSYAMANADESVKSVANFSAPANTEDGVLQVLENLLKEI